MIFVKYFRYTHKLHIDIHIYVNLIQTKAYNNIRHKHSPIYE